MAAEPASKPAVAPTTAPTAPQNGPIIKDVYQKHFLIGTAGDFPGNYSDAEKALARDHFNILTPENCMKPALVHPQEDTWRFERSDALVKFCEENGLAIHGHTLSGTPRLATGLSAAARRQVTERLLKPHPHAVGRYKGKPRGGRHHRGHQRPPRREL
jgi:GH35 family endo-1,4-beta-xylanase